MANGKNYINRWINSSMKKKPEVKQEEEEKSSETSTSGRLTWSNGRANGLKHRSKYLVKVKSVEIQAISSQLTLRFFSCALRRVWVAFSFSSCSFSSWKAIGMHPAISDNDNNENNGNIISHSHNHQIKAALNFTTTTTSLGLRPPWFWPPAEAFLRCSAPPAGGYIFAPTAAAESPTNANTVTIRFELPVTQQYRDTDGNGTNGTNSICRGSARRQASSQRRFLSSLLNAWNVGFFFSTNYQCDRCPGGLSQACRGFHRLWGWLPYRIACSGTPLP